MIKRNKKAETKVRRERKGREKAKVCSVLKGHIIGRQ
jgi:hypothetical protein